MVVLLNALDDPSAVMSGKRFLREHGQDIKDKHIFYILKPLSYCDRGNFKFGKSHSAFNRIKQYTNIYCGDVTLYYVQTFSERDSNFWSGEQPVDLFEKQFSRSLKKLNTPFVRGNEFVQASGRKMKQALEMTKGEPVAKQAPIRRSTRALVVADRVRLPDGTDRKPWWERF